MSKPLKPLEKLILGCGAFAALIVIYYGEILKTMSTPFVVTVITIMTVPVIFLSCFKLWEELTEKNRKVGSKEDESR